jgi:hypothetical protein
VYQVNNNYRKFNVYNSRDAKIASWLFFIAIALGVVGHFSGLMTVTLRYSIFLTSLGCGIVGIFLYMLTGLSTNQKENRLLIIWFFLCAYMVIVGVVNYLFSDHTTHSGWLISQDIRYIVYFSIGFVLANKNYINFYHLLMQYLGILAMIFGFIAIFLYPFQFSSLELGARLGIWDVPYYLWWLSASVFAYNYSYTRMTNKSKVIGYGCFLVYLIFGLLFLKRSSLVNCVFLLIFPFFMKRNLQKISLKKVLLFSLLIMFCVFLLILFKDKIIESNIFKYISVAVDQLFNRFEIDSFSTYDRARETNLFFSKNSIVDILLGYGIGNYYVYDGYLYNALHTGWSNLFYKGGIFYFGFWVYLFITFLVLFFKRRKLSDYMLACLMVGFSASLSLLYEFSWTYTILPIGYATPIAYLFQSDKKRGPF